MKQKPDIRVKRASDDKRLEINEFKLVGDKKVNQSLAHIRVRSEAELQVNNKQKQSNALKGSASFNQEAKKDSERRA